MSTLFTKALVVFPWRGFSSTPKQLDIMGIYYGPSSELGTGAAKMKKETHSSLNFVHLFIQQIPVLGIGDTTMIEIECV